MKIRSLVVQNFRGVRFARLEELQTTVIIAGTNGSGKSTLFDAIRLLKSAYGSYQANEVEMWMGEFQVNLNDPASLITLLNNRVDSLSISAEFQLNSEELTYIAKNIDNLIRELVLRRRNPLAGTFPHSATAVRFIRDPQFEAEVDAISNLMKNHLSSERLDATISVSPSGVLQRSDSPLLELVFSCPVSGKIGLIDYNGPQRMFNREPVHGLNVNLSQPDPRQTMSHSLYNYSAKYQNIKNEMAGAYIRSALVRAALPLEQEIQGLALDNDINRTLIQLFETFFPDKKFRGPRPNINGQLEFPVFTSDGSEHDLNDLSAGEKEILYGYLRLRAAAPRHSIILLDEPELHLNPRLIRKLPAFYNKHLGTDLENQIWLVTHSDALLREIKDDSSYSIYHMSSAGSISGELSQAEPLKPRSGLEKIVLDLVGDLATYRPGGKLVIFEGGGGFGV